jgi:long-subunit acyl-CoA synthetase (AMP-forming)
MTSVVYEVDRKIASLGDTFLATVDARGDAPAILDSDLSVVMSWREYGEQARRAAAGLTALGVRPGDTVGLLLTNRPEFHIADAGALLCGATPFSMYNTSAPEQLAHLVTDAGCRVVITESSLVDGLLAAYQHGATDVEHIFVVDGPESGLWLELLASGEPAASPAPVQPDDLATLIYTSGTTGPPKGVQLTHDNVLAMIGDVAGLLGVEAEHRAISYLPMAHIAERICTHYLPMVVGFAVVCCPRAGDVIGLLRQVRPQLFFSPPRLWEKLQAAVAPALADGAGSVAVRRQLGMDRVQAALTGAAPCSPAVVEFFGSIGIALREVYGLSETTGVVTLTPADGVRIGTVGPPVPSAEVRIADDGELLVRGRLLMAGYRNLPEATAEAIDAGGWLHTGDVARIDGDGYLRIVDRKKELIINAAGKNMSPANIEARLKESSALIGQVCVIGDGRPYNVALIVVEAEIAATYSSPAEVRAEVQAGVDRANARLARVERIKRFTVLTEEWLPDSEVLTPTMKLKRRGIAENYAAEIDALYATGETR